MSLATYQLLKGLYFGPIYKELNTYQFVDISHFVSQHIYTQTNFSLGFYGPTTDLSTTC